MAHAGRNNKARPARGPHGHISPVVAIRPRPEGPVLVTGGAGFIGSYAVEALLARGSFVRVLDNFSAGRREYLPRHDALEVIAGDVRDPGAVQVALAGCTRALHLAASVSVSTSVVDPVSSFEVNVRGFLNVLEAARRHRVEKLVYASSVAVYGESGAAGAAAVVQPVSPYGLEKAIGDQYSALYARLYGLRCLGLRYSHVYGPRQPAASPYGGLLGRYIDAVLLGKRAPLGEDHETARDFVFVDDAVSLTVDALFSEETGVKNVSSGSAVSAVELLRVIETCARTADEGAETQVSWAARSAPVNLQDGIGRLIRTLRERQETWAAQRLGG